jgi:hypothetical protein
MMKIAEQCGDRQLCRRKLLGVWLILVHAVAIAFQIRFMSALVISGHLHCNRPGPLYPRKRTFAAQIPMSASLIGRFGSSAFRLSTNCSVDVAHGLVLLSGIGTRALPSWGSRTRWTNLRGGLAGKLTAGPSRHAISPHPSSREGHHSTTRWSSRFSYRV